MTSIARSHNYLNLGALVVCCILTVTYVVPVVEGLGTFGLDIHHRYSDKAKKFLDNDGLPEKDTANYFNTLVHRDQLRGRRHLAATDHQTPLTSAGGNLTVFLGSLGFLQYGSVFVGTPGTEFLVALDTGSDLFWLPCECEDCPRKFKAPSGELLDLNIYALNGTSTEKAVTCDDTICGSSYQCLTEQNVCIYKTNYLGLNASSTGLLVEDVLQLVTNENQPSSVNTTVTFGCGVTQTGSFLTNGPINGLLGLGLEDISVPSTLASQGLIANSFSMCFGPDLNGRIVFGDKGSLDQSETPFIISASNPTYTASIEEVSVGSSSFDLAFSAIFDSGSSFTLLPAAVYTTVAESFDSQVLDPRRNGSDLSFEYCYTLNSTTSGFESPRAPNLTLTMKGGDQFNVPTPFVVVYLEDSTYAYCLGLIKSASVSIIGQSFLKGNRVVFDREKLVLGWKSSDCYDDIEQSNTGSNTSTPVPPPSSRTPPPPRTTTIPNVTETSEPPSSPAANRTNGFRVPGTGNASELNSFTWKLVMAFFSLFSHYFLLQSS